LTEGGFLSTVGGAFDLCQSDTYQGLQRLALCGYHREGVEMVAQTDKEKVNDIVYRFDSLSISFRDLIRSPKGGRNPEQIRSVLDVLQSFKGDRPVRVFTTDGIRDFCLSLDPVNIQRGWQLLYQWWGLWLKIPEVPYNTQKIQEEKSRGRILIFVADQLSDVPALRILTDIFPSTTSWHEFCPEATNRDVVIDPIMSGWMFIESSLDTPYLNTTEATLREILAKQGAIGYGLTVYAVFSQFCKIIHGSYPDIDAQARLLGSFFRGRVIFAGFLTLPDGWGWQLISPGSGGASNRLGGRSATV